MQRFLYMFGFEPPELRASNERLGTDFEDSESFFVVAVNREQALGWGNQIADAYLQKLYRDDSVGLKSLGYQGFIEEEGAGGTGQLQDIPVVRYGEYLDVTAMIRSKETRIRNATIKL